MPSGWDDSTIDKIKSGEPIKKVLAVLDFEGYKFLKGKADLKMSDMLTTSLVKSNRFEMVERNKIDKVFKVFYPVTLLFLGNNEVLASAPTLLTTAASICILPMP